MNITTIDLVDIAPTLAESMHYIPGRAGTRSDAQRELNTLRGLVIAVLNEGHTGEFHKRCTLCRHIRNIDKLRKAHKRSSK